jgi:TP901 family phage tail tape measure protein
MSAAAIVATKFTAIDQFSSKVAKMKMSVQSFAAKAETSVARADRAFRKLTPAIGGAMKQFLSFASAAAISTAIVGGVGFSVKSVMDYEKSLASLSAITGVTGSAFNEFKNQVSAVAGDTRKSSIEVAKAFEIVGSAKSDLLENAEALAEVSKAAIILSKASGDELAGSAESLVGVMNQFGLESDQAARTMNVLAAGSKVGAATIGQVAEAMKNFGSVASGANVSVEQSVALVEVLSTKGVKGAEAGTALRGSLLKLQQAGLGYASGQFNINDALEEARKKIAAYGTETEKDKAILKMFGAENISTGKILLSNIDLFEQFTKGVTGTNTATEQAEINANTLSNRLGELSNAWVNIITGSSKAGSSLDAVKNVVKLLTDNLETVVSVGSKILLFFAAWKAAIIVAQLALGAYNIVLGITGALSSTASIAIGQNAIALKAYTITTGIATVAAKAWAFALNLGIWPITLIAIGIAALIALVVKVVQKWNEWGAAVSLFLGPLGLVISMIQSFRRNWDLIKKAFSEGGILEGLKMIGATLLDAVLMPLQQILEIASGLPGKMGEWAATGAAKIEEFRANLGVNTTTDESGNPLNPTGASPMLDSGQPFMLQNNPQAVAAQSSVERMESVSRQNVSIDIKDQTGRASVSSDNDMIPINLTTTQAF